MLVLRYLLIELEDKTPRPWSVPKKHWDHQINKWTTIRPVVEGLALRIHKGEVPEALKGVPIFALDIGGLLAVTKYRGDFEARLKATIKGIEKIPGATIFIDEIHTIVGAGATSSGSLDASNILKPLLISGTIRCLGATTYEEYKNHFEKDRALSRRFQKIEIQEPAVHETVSILRGLKAYYEHFHGVLYTDRALKAAAELSAKYINDKYLPDKAIDVIDEECHGDEQGHEDGEDLLHGVPSWE